jgi:hypothetical protein
MGFAALLSSLALLASHPSAMVLAQADAPTASNRAGNADRQAAADAVAKGEEPYPTGAPTDEYGFMAWCYGALATHLALYDKVLPEVRRIEGEFPDPGVTLEQVMNGYKAQHEAGSKDLVHYGRALDIEEATGKTGGIERSLAVAKGRDAWKGSDVSDPRQLAQVWMSWALPDRCQATAARIAPIGG